MRLGIKLESRLVQLFVLIRGDLEIGLESVVLIFMGCSLLKKNMVLLKIKY